MLSKESLSEALTYYRKFYMPEEFKPRFMLVRPEYMHHFNRIRAEIKRRDSYAAGRRLAQHIHSLRGK